MANVKQAAERGAVAANAVPTPPAKFKLARLRRDCLTLYGVSTSTFDGATVGINPEAEFTVKEMGDQIQKWTSTPMHKKPEKEGN